MNGTNKAIVGIVFGIALLYAALSLVCTVLGMLDGSAWPSLFFPHGEDLGIALADIPGIGALAGPINDFTELFGDTKTVGIAVVAAGFVLAVAGMFTPWAMNVKGTENPAQYLWTKRPGATVRSLFAPWGLIGSAWAKNKALVVVPIVLG